MMKKLGLVLTLVLCAVLLFTVGSTAFAAGEVLQGHFNTHSTCYNYGEEIHTLTVTTEKPLNPATVQLDDFVTSYIASNGRLTPREITSIEVSGNLLTMHLKLTGSAVNTWVNSLCIALVGEVTDTSGTVYTSSNILFDGQINPELDQFKEADTEHVRYRLFAPEGDGQAPLYVWLHGAGEFSDDNRQQVSCSNLVNWISPAVQSEFGANGLYILAVQSPEIPHNPEYVMEAIQQVIDNYDIDTSRIYLAGCSRGGLGVNQTLAAYPNFFAAAISNCASESITPEAAATLTDVPILLVHAINDPLNVPSISIGSYNNLKAAGSDKVWCTFFTNPPANETTGASTFGHFSWIWIHNNFTSTEPEFIKGNGVYTRNGTDYPYVSTPLADIGKGYENVADWLADQQNLKILEGEYYLHTTNYIYGEELDAVEIKLDVEIDPETVEEADFQVYTGSGNRKSQRAIQGVEVDGNTIIIYTGKTGSGVNSNATNSYQVDLVGSIASKSGSIYTGDNLICAGQINPAIDQFIEGETEHMKYRLFVPETQGKKPLIVWLHGGGEFGTDNRIHLAASSPTNYALPEYQAIFGEAGAYVLAPQSPEPKPHITTNIMETIYDVLDKYDVDTNRIYVMGCSQGGKTTNELVSEYPDFFAAAISNCPYQSQITEEAAKNLVDFPIIFFHATNDTTAWPYESIESYNHLKAAGSENAWCVFYSRNPNNPVTGRAMMGHWSWTWLHNNPTTEEEFFINGEGTYSRNGVDYPFVSTPLSEIGKGYPNILSWLADQSKAGIEIGTAKVDKLTETTASVPVVYTDAPALTTVRLKLDSALPIIDVISENDVEFNPATNEVIVFNADGGVIDKNLFTLIISVEDFEDGRYPVNGTALDVTDAGTGSIDARVISGAVIIDSTYPKGDLSQDGEVTNADLILLARYLVHLTELTEKQLEAADIDDNGVINNSDLVLIARMVVGA